jgi:hypothetical protein
MSPRRWSSFLERHQCVAWTELARQVFEEIEDDSSSSSSSLNSSISSGSSMDMSDDDDNNISDGELSFAFSFAFDKASTIANKLNQPIKHQGIEWHLKHGPKIVELSSSDDAGLTFFDSGPSTYKNCLTSSGRDFLVTLLGQKRRFVLEKRRTLPLFRLFCSCA